MIAAPARPPCGGLSSPMKRNSRSPAEKWAFCWICSWPGTDTKVPDALFSSLMNSRPSRTVRLAWSGERYGSSEKRICPRLLPIWQLCERRTRCPRWVPASAARLNLLGWAAGDGAAGGRRTSSLAGMGWSPGLVAGRGGGRIPGGTTSTTCTPGRVWRPGGCALGPVGRRWAAAMGTCGVGAVEMTGRGAWGVGAVGLIDGACGLVGMRGGAVAPYAGIVDWDAGRPPAPTLGLASALAGGVAPYASAPQAGHLAVPGWLSSSQLGQTTPRLVSRSWDIGSPPMLGAGKTRGQ